MAPWSIRAVTISDGSMLSTATSSGVLPKALALFGFAPLSSNSFRQSRMHVVHSLL